MSVAYTLFLRLSMLSWRLLRIGPRQTVSGQPSHNLWRIWGVKSPTWKTGIRTSTPSPLIQQANSLVLWVKAVAQPKAISRAIGGWHYRHRATQTDGKEFEWSRSKDPERIAWRYAQANLFRRIWSQLHTDAVAHCCYSARRLRMKMVAAGIGWYCRACFSVCY